MIDGLSGTGAAALHSPALRIGTETYWAMIAVWIGLGMTAYAVVWRVAKLEVLAAIFAAVAGCMIALLALYLRYHPNNVAVVFHPLEQMFAFASGSEPQLATGGSFLNANRLQRVFSVSRSFSLVSHYFELNKAE